MIEETDMEIEGEWIAAVVDRAVRARAVAVFVSMHRLLAQLPITVRDDVRRELEDIGPAEWWCVASVPLNAPLGAWLVWQRADRRDVVWLIVVVSQADYEALLQAQLANSVCN